MSRINKSLKSIPSHVAIDPVVLRPLLDVVAVHPVVLLVGCFNFHQLLQLVYAISAFAILMRRHIFLNWVEF